ncbi:MAG: tRNA (cytidine(34)-2'-O)-methyltransferase [Helicobacteraceae bacterium]|nr:tRNA (cytidine(34)-2'-O)-methyltransferase [Helicobacteraceae bacterium]
MFNIVLLSPKIPENTGAIGRTCVCSGSRLNVIAPTPLDFSEKRLRRAGLDYWQHLDFKFWRSLEEFLAANPINDRHFFFTTKSDRPFFEAKFQPNDFLWFGSEDLGLPEELWRSNADRALRLPMRKSYRSLNLSLTAGIAIYEGIRQNYRVWSGENE